MNNFIKQMFKIIKKNNLFNSYLSPIKNINVSQKVYFNDFSHSKSISHSSKSESFLLEKKPFSKDNICFKDFTINKIQKRLLFVSPNPNNNDNNDNNSNKYRYALSIILIICGLFSKQIIILIAGIVFFICI